MFRAEAAYNALAISAGALSLSLCAGQALAGPSTLRDVIFGNQAADDRRAAAPMVARYVADEGPSFVLDQSTGTPLLKFEGSNEVWVLNRTPAARGDVIYRNELGEPVLRATRLGGVTLFARTRAGGSPAAVAGAAASLKLQALPAAQLLRRLAQASVQASRAAQRLIVFDAPDVRSGTEAIYADAATVTAEAMIRISKVKGGKTVLDRIGKVQLVDPRKGVAGRPSSNRVIAAAAAGR